MQRLLTHCLFSLVVLAAPDAQAGSWGVSPILLDFSPRTKTGSVTVTNDDTKPVTLQLELMSWSQDAAGQDVYVESNDLVFFPRLMTIQPNSARVIRVGTKLPAPASERAYRLFIEEIGGMQPESTGGAAIAVKMRFGLPVFVSPVKEQRAGAIDNLNLLKGQLRLKVRNTGNKRFRFETVTARAGADVLAETQGWYLLAGAQREYRLNLDAAACAGAGTIIAAVSAEGLDLQRELATSPAQCRP